MTAREREKATLGIGVVRQGVGCTRVEAGGGLKGVTGDRREREVDEKGVAINDETRMQEGNARKKKG